MVWLLLGALLIIAAIREVGIISALCYLAVVSVVVFLYTKIRTKAHEEDSSKILKAIANALPSVLRTASIILVIIGIIAFIIGCATSSSSITFNGDRCSACGGDGWFMSKECPSCKGTGYEFGRKSVFWSGTWSGVMLAVSSAIVFLSTYGDSDADKSQKESTVSKDQEHTDITSTVKVRGSSGDDRSTPLRNSILVGKVIEGRYIGSDVRKLLDKNVIYIETEDGTKLALSKKNAISIDDISEQYSPKGTKTLMVMWNDTEISVIQFGLAKK